MTEQDLSKLIDSIYLDGYSHGRGEDADYDFEKQAILEAFVKLHEENARLVKFWQEQYREALRDLK